MLGITAAEFSAQHKAALEWSIEATLLTTVSASTLTVNVTAVRDVEAANSFVASNSKASPPRLRMLGSRLLATSAALECNFTVTYPLQNRATTISATDAFITVEEALAVAITNSTTLQDGVNSNLANTNATTVSVTVSTVSSSAEGVVITVVHTPAPSAVPTTVPPTAVPTTEAVSSSSSSLSDDAILGIGVGAAVGVCGLLAAAYFATLGDNEIPTIESLKVDEADTADVDGAGGSARLEIVLSPSSKAYEHEMNL